MISENLTSLNGKSVKDYDPAKGIQDANATVYRLRLDYDGFSAGKNIPDLLKSFCSDKHAASVEELIIGAFDFEGENSSPIVDALTDASSQLPKLKVLFIGDITYEEYEISWINQCDMSRLLNAYPHLEYFRVRGGNELSIGKALQHNNLRYLILESGGLPPNVIEEVANAKLPKLEHLELWLGSENYGFGSTVQDFTSILKRTGFPELRYLGLRDSEIADDLAKALDQAPVLNQLEVLDLSMGTLGDEGAKALLANAAVRKLKMLDLHHHYISDEVSQQLRQLGITVNLDDKQQPDDDYRYIQVAE